MSELDTILRAYLVRCGNPDGRKLLAARLESEGMTWQHLTMVCETLEAIGRSPEQTAPMIGQILKTQESWKLFHKDAVHAAEKKAKRDARRGVKPRRSIEPRGPVNMPREPTHVTQDRALREYVIERVKVDGKTPEFMAGHVGEPLEVIQAMLEGE